ncbi:hypothetical protein [Sphingomonas sp. Leaf10]|uniref:hypothetical protein n=1 Tax=Sphingomonas sp. Leaf10 TaxID=1735676 RepID=UPI000B169BB6|nr:hypothetical protein [Sphingomonas sp. Leaf10]
MRNMFFGIALLALASATTQAEARTGGGVSVGRDATISVQQDSAVTAVAIGQRAIAGNYSGAIMGDVNVGRDATITVHQKSAVTAVAIGQDVKATNVAGAITSQPL